MDFENDVDNVLSYNKLLENGKLKFQMEIFHMIML